MKRYVKIYSGVSIEEDQSIHFNFNSDNVDNDVIFLKKDVSGTFEDNDIEYVYAYEYNPKSDHDSRKAVRTFLKHVTEDDEDIYEFVENGVFALDKYHRLEEFGAVVTTYSTSRPSLTEVMHDYFAEYCTHNFISFELLKKAYKDVKFDEEGAKNTLIVEGRTEVEASREVRRAARKFERLKETDQLFEMKKFLPRGIRSSFSDFLKFKSEEEKQIYLSLQGVNVLIFDDFLTSGATVKEIISYLKSFNENNTLTVFVLVKQ